MVLALDHADHNFSSRIYIQKEKIVKKGIAFFDFDGTITTKDTLLEFIKYSKGSFRFYLGFLINSPYLVAFKLKLIPNQTAKEKVLAFFFKGTTEKAFQEKCDSFATDIIPTLIRPKAIEEIKKLQAAGTPIVIVSASPENWIARWADTMQVKLIATKLVVKDGLLTGKISGNNCYGEEKVRRINETYPSADYEWLAAYGDSSGDKPMLAKANTSFYKPFRK